MAKKTNKVSVNQFEKAIVKPDIQIIDIGVDEKIEVEVKRKLNLDEMLTFVSEVVSFCIDAGDETYIPEAYRFAIRVAVINGYSNLTMPSNIDKQYELAYYTSAFNQIMSVIDREQFTDIIDAVDMKLNHKLSLQRAEISAGVNAAIGKMNQITDMFDAISEDDVKSLIGGLTKIQSINNEDIINALAVKEE